jgi:diguanylate cyclase (GGDEF)-like protein/PAS domain S-box-containing protein
MEIIEEQRNSQQKKSTVKKQAEKKYFNHQQQIYRQTDRMFAVLMLIQWLAGIFAALIISPSTWIGQTSQVHLHVWAAFIVGGAISFFPILLAIFTPGKTITRYSIAVGQMLMSSLLIHLTGGRIETHFHVFGSLAFLSFYRDWKVLLPATIVVALDHMLRGLFYPQSVFGVLTAENWRWVEHAAWVAFEDFFLVLSCLRGQKEMQQIAENTAQLDANEARYRVVTNSASDAIITIDEEGSILFANHSAEKVFGFRAEDLIGEKLFKLFPSNIQNEHEEGMKRYLSNGKKQISRQAIEVPAVHKEGHEILIEISFGEYNSGNGRIFTAVMRDITERKRIEEQLRKAEENRNLFKLANDAIIISDPQSEIILDVNDYACKLFGYSRDEFVGLQLKQICYDNEGRKNHTSKLLAEGAIESYESVHYRKDGTPINVLINASIIEFSGKPAILSIKRDITSWIKADTALYESENKFRTLIESMSEGLLQIDLNDRIIFTNKRFCEMMEYSEEELLGRCASEIFLDEEGQKVVEQANQRRLEGVSENYEIQLKTKNGKKIWSLIGAVPLTDSKGEISGSMSVHTDITQRKQAEEALLYNAMHDKLTGLPNRALFLEHLRRVMGRSPHREKTFAVLFIDFDGFKLINDSLGHLEGDDLLKLISRRLEVITRATDVVARLGGDEFTILLDELNNEDEALFVVDRIQELFKESFNLSGREIFISASIGIAFRNSKYKTPDQILRDADIAMYRAKRSGKARFEIFSEAMHEQVSSRLLLETELRLALERNEFKVFYQPIMDIASNRLIGFESLIRWFHPERGQIMPNDFIPIAEETGLIVPIGEFVLQEACRQTFQWHSRFPQHSNLSISVNLSSKQFLQPDLVERIKEILKETKMNPTLLHLEITESHMMENSQQAIVIIKKLRELGIRLSIDDFGTGYSSLSYLQQLPINYLKIDRSFINLMSSNTENGEIVRTIVMLARNLNLEVIAEGIETEEQAQLLVGLNCSFGQGYLYSKPTDADQAEEHLLKSNNPSNVSHVGVELGRID